MAGRARNALPTGVLGAPDQRASLPISYLKEHGHTGCGFVFTAFCDDLAEHKPVVK
jgi:hypothetical protein